MHNESEYGQSSDRLSNRLSNQVLIVDDDPNLLRLLALRLESGGYQVSCADSAACALPMIERDMPDLVITDLRMDGMDGCALQREITLRWPGVPVVVITAHGTIPDAVQATQAGAFAFLTKPLDPLELLSTVQQALAQSFAAPINGEWRECFLGDSEATRRLLERTRRVAPGNANVLITGPSGSGKDALARALHRASKRSGDLVAVNCAAIPEQLLESELFGHRKGAFTGAVNHNEGLMAQAQGGTLFLDEIGDMPIELQAKLLRVIEDRAVRAVGAQEARAVDLRVIAATHQDLDTARAEGRFRDDLYYRLRVIQLELPALCDRAADIPVLVQHKLAQLASDQTAGIQRFSPAALSLLMNAPWPGNVRQLFNLVEQCVALSSSRVIGEGIVREALADWSMSGRTDQKGVPPLARAKEQFMHDYLCEVLQLAEGNVSEAARLAQRNRSDFYKLLDRHHVDRDRFKVS